ncbi:hypothetical protein ES708_33223 [subsurface metagenome]
MTTAKIADDAVTSAKIDDGTIVNADIDAAAAIAGDKINPDVTNAVVGDAAGYAIARGTAAVTGTVADIDTGLTTVVECVLTVESDAAPALLWSAVSWDPGSGDGLIDIFVWMPTGAANPTLIAATTAVDVSWIAIGTP